MTNNIYQRKQYWKILLFLLASIIVFASLSYTNNMVKRMAEEEAKNVKIWADAITQKAELVTHTDAFFEKVREEARRNMETWAGATNEIVKADFTTDLTFYTEIIERNKNIPVILTDSLRNIQNTLNVDFDTDSIKVLEGDLLLEFTDFEPIEAYNNSYIYYKESRIYTDLRATLDELVNSFFSEVVLNSASVPVIITDSTKTNVIIFGNIDSELMQDSKFVASTIADMNSSKDPIKIDLPGQGYHYIYYQDSYLLRSMKYFPIIIFIMVGVFLFIAYILFSVARRSEQNQVWAGMAKETAHQLGTPISSLMAWNEYLKLQGAAESAIEIDKDIHRLELIADRFSKIGSEPVLEDSDLVQTIQQSIEYLKLRIPKKISVSYNAEMKNLNYPHNINLFEWVIENLIRNAVDAIEGEGKIDINLSEFEKTIYLDITDSGRGIPRRIQKTIFHPGYTTKKRGWGLGLTLVKRIVENYHSGKIFIKQSQIGKGTTIRIVLKNK